MDLLQTPVWQLIGLANRPGLLTLAGGFLSFETAEGVHFQCHASQLRDVTWPWYYFNGGFKVTVDGTRYRFSFARPNGAAAAWRPVSAANNLFDLGRATKTGKAWKKELSQAR